MTSPDIPESQRLYPCSYPDCSYSAVQSRADYIQHIAFKHEEWYKRINGRLEAAGSRPGLTAEGEKLSLVKEAFVKDPRLQPVPTPGAPKKLSWTDGVLPQNGIEAEYELAINKQKEVSEHTIAEQKIESNIFIGNVQSELRCQLCTKVMKIDPTKTTKNRQSYIIHLMESHFERTMFSDIPNLEKYSCPYPSCNHSTELKAKFRIHLAFSHKEFSKRVNRRVSDLERTMHSADDPSQKLDEIDKLKDIKTFFQSDSRVTAPDKNPAEYWLKDDTLFSTEEISEAADGKKPRPTHMVTFIKQEDAPGIKLEKSDDSLKGNKNTSHAKSISELNTERECAVEKGELESEQEKPDTEKEKSKIEHSETPGPKGKGKGKKNKKELKTQNLRKDPKPETQISEKNEKNGESLEISDSKEMIEQNLEKTHEEIVDEQDNKVKEPPEAIKQPENTRKPVLELIENCKPASAEATPAVASELYTCKQCRKQFNKRPVCIMHIITEHMQERFPGVPHLIDEKYLCHHAGCTYNSVKRNGLLAHLTLKHNAINIMDVTELMLHSDEDEAQPPRDLSDSQSGIKQETVAAPLPVTITEADQASVSWKCRNCDSPFNSEDAVRQHVLLSHLLDQFADLAPPDQKIYSCTHCFKYSTVSRVNFIKHLGMQHQVIREETLGRYIEHSRSLLLDIDVIKCRCGKQFDKHRQLKDHIVSNHYKDKFRQIPKGKERYECRKHHEPSCFFVADNRGLLIKHLVNEHKFLSDLDIDKFKLSNGSDSQSAVANNSDCSNENADNENNDGSPNMDQDDSHSSIDFNDSVSQAATSKNKKNIACKKAFPETHEPVVVEIEEVEIEEIPFENNTGHKCPICSKHIAQRSNFEDHLQTHKILNDVVFHCVECSFATSFAQMYYHLISFHKESSQIKLQCLCCKINMSSSGVKESIKQIRDHSTHPASQTKHQVSAKKFLELPKRTLYSMFRYNIVFSCAASL